MQDNDYRRAYGKIVRLDKNPQVVKITEELQPSKQSHQSFEEGLIEKIRPEILNAVQKDDKPLTNPPVNGGVKDDKSVSNIRQKNDNSVSLPLKTDDKPAPKKMTNGPLNGGQKNNFKIDKYSYSSLIGLQKRCVFLLFELTKLSQDKNTVAVNMQHIAEQLGVGINSIKKSI